MTKKPTSRVKKGTFQKGQSGNRYFSGRLGTARIMLFKDDEDGDDKAPQASQEGQGQEKTTPNCQKTDEGHQRAGKRA